MEEIAAGVVVDGGGNHRAWPGVVGRVVDGERWVHVRCLAKELQREEGWQAHAAIVGLPPK